MNDIFSEENLKEAEQYPGLGPAYFCSKDVIDRFSKGFENEHFKPLIDEFTKRFNEKLWDGVANSLMMDTECNLQQMMYRQVDDCVKALLGGERWALERYVLDSYHCEEIRAAVAAHIPEELQNARIKDLEADNKRLGECLRARMY